MQAQIESGLFSDDFLRRFAEKHGIELEENCSKGQQRILITAEQIIDGVRDGVMEKLGGGFCRVGHRIWQLEKEGDNLYLVRKEDEQV